jgi:hypothetical protein
MGTIYEMKGVQNLKIRVQNSPWIKSLIILQICQLQVSWFLAQDTPCGGIYINGFVNMTDILLHTGLSSKLYFTYMCLVV